MNLFIEFFSRSGTFKTDEDFNLFKLFAFIRLLMFFTK
jgi:hypothetical protein